MNRSHQTNRAPLFFLISCFFIFGCENDERKLREWNEKRIVVEVGKDIESYLSNQGKMKAKLIAPLMLRYQADTIYTEFPKTLHMDFYDDSTKIESWLDARYGKYFENLNKAVLRDSVVFISIKGDTLKTSELWWDQNQQKFYTDSVVSIHTIDKRIYGGKGLEAAEDFSWKIIKYPTGTVQVKDKGFPE